MLLNQITKLIYTNRPQRPCITLLLRKQHEIIRNVIRKKTPYTRRFRKCSLV